MSEIPFKVGDRVRIQFRRDHKSLYYGGELYVGQIGTVVRIHDQKKHIDVDIDGGIFRNFSVLGAEICRLSLSNKEAASLLRR